MASERSGRQDYLPERMDFSRRVRNWSKKESWCSVMVSLLMTFERFGPSGTWSSHRRWRTQRSILAPPTGTILPVMKSARTKRTSSVRLPVKRKGKSDSGSLSANTSRTSSSDAICSAM